MVFKFTKPSIFSGKRLFPGDTVAVPDAIAESLEKRGFGNIARPEPLDLPKPEPEAEPEHESKSTSEPTPKKAKEPKSQSTAKGKAKSK